MVSSTDRRRRDAALTRLMLLLYAYSLAASDLAAAALGLPAPTNLEVHLLITVARTPGGSSGDLARATGVSRSDVSTTLGVLERHRLITRDRDARDRRVVRVSATGRGQRALATFSAALGDFFRDTAPVAKEALHLLDHDPQDPPLIARTPIEAAELLAVAGREASAAINRVGQRRGMTSPRARHALALLADNEAVRPTHLARDLHLSRSATTELIDGLQTRGLVARRREVEGLDQRAVLVTLTAPGRESVRQLGRALDAHLAPIATALAATLDLIERLDEAPQLRGAAPTRSTDDQESG